MSDGGHRRRRTTDPPDQEPEQRAHPDPEQAAAAGEPAERAAITAGEPAHSVAITADEPKPTGRRGRRRRRKRSLWRELPILVVIALVLAVVIKTFAVQAFFIPSGSMENTLDVNDRVLINKLIYDFRGVHRGDIVVFNGDGTWDPGALPGDSNVLAEFASGFASMFGFGHTATIYVKRVIGLPGDHVACCDARGRVTVNKVPLDESSYLHPGDVPSRVRFNVTVPADHLWVMGDHRSVSEDSRYHPGAPGGGAIPESSVLGRAFVIVWPPSRWRVLPIPSTFQQPALALGLAGAIPLTWLRRRLRGLSDGARPTLARKVTNWRTLRLK